MRGRAGASLLSALGFVSLGVLMTPVGAMANELNPTEFLGTYEWRKRVLLFFAPPGDDALETLRQVIAVSECEVDERDLVVLGIIGNKTAPVRELPESTPRTMANARALRSLYGIADEEIALVLIGKDGGEKRRTQSPQDVPALLALIDTMPMRRSEARTRGPKC